MKLAKRVSGGVIRLSFGPETTRDDIDPAPRPCAAITTPGCPCCKQAAGYKSPK